MEIYAGKLLTYSGALSCYFLLALFPLLLFLLAMLGYFAETFPQPGKQREPKPGLHNSGWMQSPGAKALQDPPTTPLT